MIAGIEFSPAGSQLLCEPDFVFASFTLRFVENSLQIKVYEDEELFCAHQFSSWWRDIRLIDVSVNHDWDRRSNNNGVTRTDSGEARRNLAAIIIVNRWILPWLVRILRVDSRS